MLYNLDGTIANIKDGRGNLEIQVLAEQQLLAGKTNRLKIHSPCKQDAMKLEA